MVVSAALNTSRLRWTHILPEPLHPIHTSFSENERQYFELLVKFNQSKDAQEKDLYFRQLSQNKKFIVATDRGIFYKMQQLCPDKEFVEAPTAGNGAACLICKGDSNEKTRRAQRRAGT